MILGAGRRRRGVLCLRAQLKVANAVPCKAGPEVESWLMNSARRIFHFLSDEEKVMACDDQVIAPWLNDANLVAVYNGGAIDRPPAVAAAPALVDVGPVPAIIPDGLFAVAIVDGLIPDGLFDVAPIVAPPDLVHDF